MKKVVSLLLVVVFVLAFSSVAFATSEDMANGLANSPAFCNENNPNRFEHKSGNLFINPFAHGTGVIGIPPEQPGLNSESDLVVEPYGAVVDMCGTRLDFQNVK